MTSNPLRDNYSAWARELERDPDREFLLTGIKEGFKIIDENVDIKKVEISNYHSATCAGNRVQVEKQLKSEIESGHYVISDTIPDIVSALAALPKPDSNEFRLIHDCSNPLGQGVNSYASIDKHSFESIDTAVRHVKTNSWMGKIDLKSAYRHVGLHPSQFGVTGLKYKFTGDASFTYFYDTRLMMGASQSVGTFHRITQSIVRMMKLKTKAKILCY